MWEPSSRLARDERSHTLHDRGGMSLIVGRFELVTEDPLAVVGRTSVFFCSRFNRAHPSREGGPTGR